MRSDRTASRERLGRQTVGAPARERLGARTGLRPVRRIARVVAAAADAVMLLGDVGQRQELRERPRDRHGRPRSAARSADRPAPQTRSGRRRAHASRARAPPRRARTARRLRACAACRRTARPAAGHRRAAPCADRDHPPRCHTSFPSPDLFSLSRGVVDSVRAAPKCRFANPRPEPDFRYFSKRRAAFSVGNSIETTSDHGRYETVWPEGP